ncbi:hypothetical protein TUZN_0758 [Thermoproteus uzoniensis 768-20]|uniref:Uncharacterized protein n=1 Tax=Thermoproteus uzoniensis (strain 768-20) TaxID=999630 RepID=F2L4Z8_THEU7|nr:hypothetical protein [Thermoproteus uzoniensis]AEA12247.1 hypothetical protein TUZN_0758 [Thermoproteus uzoniensis 768-20]
MLIDRLYRDLARNIRFFERALALEKEAYGLTYVSSRAVAEAAVCPRAAAFRAAEEEVEVFARALRDRVRYAAMLGIVEGSYVDALTKRAARGDRQSAEALLRIGRDLGPGDISAILPRLREEFEAARRAAGKVVVTAARGAVREAAAYVKYAEVYPYAGMGHRYGNYVFYAVAGVGVDHVYLFRLARSREAGKRLALAEGDVAAAAFKKENIKLHIYVPGEAIYSFFEKASDPTPKYKALIEGECRPGRACASCRYREVCECVGDIPRRRHAGS